MGKRREPEALVDAALLDGGGAEADDVVPSVAQLGELPELGVDVEGRLPVGKGDLRRGDAGDGRQERPAIGLRLERGLLLLRSGAEGLEHGVALADVVLRRIAGVYAQPLLG